jgi:hypothetical protein
MRFAVAAEGLIIAAYSPLVGGFSRKQIYILGIILPIPMGNFCAKVH